MKFNCLPFINILLKYICRGGLGLIDLKSGRVIHNLLENANEGVFTIFAAYTRVSFVEISYFKVIIYTVSICIKNPLI